jgi:uncharacterized membrane protein YhhN
MRNLLFVLALIAGTSFYANHWIGFDGAAMIAWKGAGVALLALWAGSRARSTDGWLIAAVMAFGALGDVLIEFRLEAGALAFLVGHVVAIVLYLRNRSALLALALLAGPVVAFAAWLLPADRGAAPGIALYALGLGVMAGTAWFSRFPRATVGLGAVLFVLSDLLIFARLGPLHGSPLPDFTVWPTYFAGQALIAWGVVTGLRR